MRKTQIILLLILMIPVLFISCKKETNDKIDQLEKYYLDNPASIAQVKFIHAYTPLTINGLTAGTTTSGVGFRITMDASKLNGATNTSTFTNTLVYGGQPGSTTYTGSFFPATSAYTFLPPGARNFKFTMNRITSGNFAPIAGDEVFNSTFALVAGKKYSIFISDPYAPAAYMIEDNFTQPERTNYGVRFINLCGDIPTRFDVVSSRHGMLFSNVAYKETRDFIYPTIPFIPDTIFLKTAGTNTIVSSVPTFNAGNQRVYTFYARGKTGVSGRTPTLNFYTNR